MQDITIQALQGSMFIRVFCKSGKLRRIISVKLENITEILIYPFGSYNNNIQAMANSHYRYVMRIGNASNSNWDQKILYRIDADHFWKNDKEFSKLDLFKWKMKFFLNKLRGK